VLGWTDDPERDRRNDLAQGFFFRIEDRLPEREQDLGQALGGDGGLEPLVNDLRSKGSNE
jgi:hypothetical protein